MRIAIDLRFYSPEPYGLSIHIRDLMEKLVDILENDKSITKIVLIFSSKIKDSDLSTKLIWWEKVNQSNQFEIFFSNAKYYSIAEQTTFLFQLNKLQLDLVYFFTFNYPILYTKPFIYQVLDLSIPKLKSKLSPKVQAAIFCLRLGIKNAKHVLMLGNNTKNDIKSFFKYNLDDPKKPNYINHTIIYNGVNPKYLTQKHSNKHKADLISSSFEMTELNEKNEILKKFKITKPYFFFISIWRKYKNVENLVDAFELFQKKHENKYQLVLSGSSDPSYPEVYQKVINSNQYKLGNIIITNKIENDEDVIKLYDNSIAMINATLSEGFGLWMVESAVRGTNVICSDIDTLREIAGQNDAVFFNPKDINDIAQKMSDFVNLDQDKKDNMAKNLYQSVQKFKWEKTAQTVYNTIKEIQYDQN